MRPPSILAKPSREEALATLLFYFQDCALPLLEQEKNAFIVLLKKKLSSRGNFTASLFKANPIVESYRKILMKLGLCHDFISLTQNELSARILKLRKQIESQAGDSFPHEGAQFLLRVDDFPSFFANSEYFSEFHEIAISHGLPYLLAVTPYLNDRGLNDSEIALLQKCQKEGMMPALHGFTHQRIRPEVSSELLGLHEKALKAALDKALSYLASLNLMPSAFVAPFNSYDAKTVLFLAERFPLLCGGPESVHSLGYRGTGFIGRSLYLPSYRGAYDLKEDLSWIEMMKAQGHGLIIPITLHWANEHQNKFSNFKRLCEKIAPRTLSWERLLSIRDQIQAAVSNYA